MRVHGRRQNYWTLDALERLKYFVPVQLRNRTDAALSFVGTNQLPNESLKNDAGCDLWAVGHRFPEEAVAVVLIIGLEIAEAEFGLDGTCVLAAGRNGALP